MSHASSDDAARSRIAFLRGLRAVRQLRPDPLPADVLDDILEVARWSGSAGNRQPWEFVVVRDRAMLGKLAAIEGANASHLANAAVGIAIVIRPEVPDLDAYDEGRLAERILLAAAAYGLGAAVGHFTGPGGALAGVALGVAAQAIGITPQELRQELLGKSLAQVAQAHGKDPTVVAAAGLHGRLPLTAADTWAASAEAKRLLGIPAERQLREMISVGYPAEHLQPTPNPPGRKPLAELVHWDHY